MFRLGLFSNRELVQDSSNCNIMEKQIANFRMANIKNYCRFNFMPVSVYNVDTMLLLIEAALASPHIQKNNDDLQIIQQQLSEVEKNISYCESNTGSRLYKWLFWSVSSAKLDGMRQQVDKYIEQVTTFQNALLLNGRQYYQQVEIKIT